MTAARGLCRLNLPGQLQAGIPQPPRSLRIITHPRRRNGLFDRRQPDGHRHGNSDPDRDADPDAVGKPVRVRSPQDAIRMGIGLVTEDRKAQGLVLPLSVAQLAATAIRERRVVACGADRHPTPALRDLYWNQGFRHLTVVPVTGREQMVAVITLAVPNMRRNWL